MPERTGDVPRPRPAGDVLASSESRYEALLANLPGTAIFLFDHELRFLVVSGGTDTWLGYAPDEIVGRTLDEVVPPERAVFLAVHCRTALAGRRHTVDVVSPRDPSVVWEVRLRPVLDTEDTVVAGLAVARDVTDTRAAERAAREGREQLQAIIDHTPALVFVVDLQGRYLLANRETERHFGVDRGGLVGMRADDLLPTDVAWPLRSADTEVLNRKQPLQAEERLPAPDGSTHTYLTVRFPLCDRDGRPYATCGIATDITERSRADERARASNEAFSTAFDRSPIGMIMGRLHDDGSAAVVRVNDALCEMLGRTPAELLTGDPWTLTAPEDRASMAESLRQLVHGELDQAVLEYEFARPDGTRAWLRSWFSLIGDPTDGRLLIGHVVDVSERRKLEIDLRHRAMHDALTGLPNRSLLEERVSHALERLDRRPTVVGVLFVDVDGFKSINDTYGHATGDDVLRQIADTVRGVLRTSDTAARLGGDEFVVLCEDLADDHEAVVIGQRLLSALRHSSWPTPDGVTASVGIATTSDSTTEPERLIGHADEAMHRAKQQGKDRLVVFAPRLHIG